MARQGRTLRWMLAVATSIGALWAYSVPALAQDGLTLWFTKGFYKSDDDAVLAVVQKFEKATGIKAGVSFYTTEDCVTKSIAAVDAGTTPDVAYCMSGDFRVTGKWAFEGKLADVSDVVEKVKDDLLPEAAAATFLKNGKTGSKAYYAIPMAQNTNHITYWKDMLEDAGFTEADIPENWEEYWDFWCGKVQAGLRQKGKRVYGVGHPLGIAASDTFQSIITWVNAYDAKVVNEDGAIVLDQPQNRAAMAEALKSYARIYERGCTPPSSVNWLDPDNNVNFHNKTTVLTHNSTISIAAKWLDDSNNPSLTPEQRATAKQNYESLVRTTGWPKKPDGKPLPNLASVKAAVIFADAKNQQRAKEFMIFWLKDENYRPSIEAALGRWYPSTKSAAASPFWTDGSDPHRLMVHKQFSEGTVPFQYVYNYRFTTVNVENVWAKAVFRIIQDKVSAEQAVEEMTKRMKEIAG